MNRSIIICVVHAMLVWLFLILRKILYLPDWWVLWGSGKGLVAQNIYRALRRSSFSV
jgi:hypothetical protein